MIDSTYEILSTTDDPFGGMVILLRKSGTIYVSFEKEDWTPRYVGPDKSEDRGYRIQTQRERASNNRYLIASLNHEYFSSNGKLWLEREIE